MQLTLPVQGVQKTVLLNGTIWVPEMNDLTERNWVPPEFSEDITLGIHFTHVVTFEIDYSSMPVKGGTQCVAYLDGLWVATLNDIVSIVVRLRFVVTSWRSFL